MSLIKGSIGLGIRVRHPLADQSSYNADIFKQWLGDLPKANIGETSRRVYHKLLDSNTQLIETSVRLRILRDLDDSIQLICNYMKRHYTVQSVSLTKKQIKVANLSRAIQLEVAIGFKTVIEDLIVDENYTNKMLPKAVVYAAYHLYKVQILTYQLCSELPKGLWHELHLLYQLAEQNQFHENVVTIENEQHSMITLYKKAILLATANPNQLRQKDIELVTKTLPSIIKNCSVGSDPDAEYDFVTNLHSDSPPFHRALIKNKMKAHFRGINVNEIILFIQQGLKTSEIKNREINLEDSIVRHLLRAWGAMTTRTFARTPTNDPIRVSMGLAASHYLISQELYGKDTEEDEDLSGEKLLDSLEGSLKNATILNDEESGAYLSPKVRDSEWNAKKDGPKLKDDTMWNAIYRKKPSLDYDDAQKPYQFMAKNTDCTSMYKYQDAATINISPGGYCMKLTGKMPGQTQAGEIIGLLEKHSDGQPNWNIGHICWIKRLGNGELHLGVHLLSPNAKPVLGHIRSRMSDKNDFKRCLSLPPSPDLELTPTLVTSKVGFSTNQRVLIKENENEFDIKLTKLITSGHSFQQFAYEMLDNKTYDNDKIISADDFNNVWDIL